MSILIENRKRTPKNFFLESSPGPRDVSHMWIERRRKDADFPPPVYFGGIRFWKLSELERWEFNQTVKPTVHSNRGFKSGAGISRRNRSVRP